MIMHKVRNQVVLHISYVKQIIIQKFTIYYLRIVMMLVNILLYGGVQILMSLMQ